jgi:peptidyl-prolyl cis-trans isomerase SurA
VRSKITILVVLLSLASLFISRARAETIERVAVVINNDIILLSELRRQALPFLESALSGATDNSEKKKRVHKLYSDLLAQLVEFQLFQQEAKTMRITVSKLEVDQAIERVRQQNNMGAEQFWEAVRNQGYNPDQYRDDVRKQLVRMKVLNQRVRTKVNVTEEEVRARYDENLRQARRTLRFRASHLFFELPPTASATEVALVRRQAETVRRALTPANFDKAMNQQGGGDLGWLSQGELPKELEHTLLTMDPGQISQPVRGPSGVHIFLLRERQRSTTNNPVPFAEVKKQLQEQMIEEAMARQQRILLEELRRKASIEMRL